MKIDRLGRKLVDQFQARPTVRAGSLITTVFGDAIAPRGGNVWLGSLIQVMANFGINERLVRTSVYRLAQDGWLQSEQVGRRSYYHLTDTGRERFDRATQRIYGEPVHAWDGNWCLLLLSGMETGDRELARKEFAWLGFATLSPNLMAHPSPHNADLEEAINRLQFAKTIVVLQGQTLQNDTALLELAHTSWGIDRLNESYTAFAAVFRPVLAALKNEQAIVGQTAFTIRTLLIQEYRKILLRDPMLAPELLPSDWQGTNAYQLCRNLYRRTHAAADIYIGTSMETADGDLPPPDRAYHRRFGGLNDT